MDLPVIHAGFQKCASTYLQTHVFPALERYRYLGRAPVIKALARFYYDDIAERERLRERLRGAMMYSEESLMTLERPFTMQRYGVDSRQGIFLANLPRIFPDGGRVLLVVRRQDELVRSWLKFKPSLFRSERDFFVDFPVRRDLDSAWLSTRRGGCLMASLDFGRIAQHIAGVLGTENLCILAHEEIAADFAGFMERLNTFFGENLDPRKLRREVVNPSPSGQRTLDIPVSPELRRLASGMLGDAGKSAIKRILARRRERAFDERFAAEIRDAYASSNAILARFTAAPLKEYGYY